VFAQLLDGAKGGRFQFVPEQAQWVMAYLPTPTSTHRDRTADGACELIDFAPRIPAGLGVNAPIEVYRLIRPLEGAPRLRAIFDPRPDYARAVVDVAVTSEGLEVLGGPQRLFLHSNVPATTIADGRPFRVDRPCFSALSAGRPPEVHDPPSVERALELTRAGWRAWSKSCALPSSAPKRAAIGALSQTAPAPTGHRGRGHDQHPEALDSARAGLPLLLAARCRLSSKRCAGSRT
jgi:hypothetical protein